jgi:acyl carrier protein
VAELASRLGRCFAAVFPEIPEVELTSARMESVAGWDSIATITLVNVIEEEFGVQIDPEDLPRLVSFEGVRNYLVERGVPA